MIKNDIQLANTRQKLARLKEQVRQAQERQAAGQPSVVDGISLTTLLRLKNELVEEIVQYETGLQKQVESALSEHD